MKNTTVITPPKIFSFKKQDLRELWHYRELFFILAQRDIKVRYKQTFLGLGWAVVQPLVLVMIFTTFFKTTVGRSVGEIPYSVFVLSGLLFWILFSNTLSSMTDSLLRNTSLIEKIYFPRILIPLASTVALVLDFAVMTLLFLGFLFYHGIIPSFLSVMMFVCAFLITFMTVSGIGLVLATLNVRFRDVKYVAPFFIQALIFVTPVIYPVSVLGNRVWLWLFNPLAGAITVFRSSLFGTGAIQWGNLAVSTAVAAAIFVLGLFFFKINERYFADLI